MAQQAIRRAKRSTGNKNALWRGLLLSIAVTMAAVIAFAVVIGLMDVNDGMIRIINQLIKIGAIFMGVRAVVPKGDESGVRRGALLGLLYMGLGVFVYALLTHQQITLWSYLIDVLMGVAAGGLSGMLIGCLRMK
ncbi:MAG: TIGR04086 family membrane protein [Clostridia bacterium]|nr:TIGR04086 family membrane protein [Clostridia bacterium]